MAIQFMNLISTKIWALTIICSIFYMIYRIRHIQDDTLVKRECVVSVAFAMVCNFTQNLLFLFGQEDECSFVLNDSLYGNAIQISYWVIIFRDIMLAIIMIYYTNRSVAAFKASDKNNNEDDSGAFVDFEMMLVSVLPHKYFALYLQQEKPKLQAYLQMIHIIRLYSEEGLVLSEKE
jgi:hypothetical protein